MKTRVLSPILSVAIVLGSLSSFAQSAPRVGREAAAKYFQRREPAQDNPSSSDHYLALHVGKFVNGYAWEWGAPGRQDNAGSTSVGMTYRLNEWSGTMDFGIRADFNEYHIAGETPSKMSFLAVLMFPEASSRFPLYFGIAGGPGVFFKQVDGESPLSLDYQLLMGARFFNVFGNTGFFFESGLKNHLLLTSSGQFNGVFLTGGAVFTF